DSVIPSIPYLPGHFNVSEGSLYCGSELCNYEYSYDSMLSSDDIYQFYIERGYICNEVKETSDDGLFYRMVRPYWQCMGKSFPRGNVVIGYSIPVTQDSSQVIKVRVHITWQPT